MSTFLQLVQAVARESGTVPDVGDPATLTNQTGRMSRIIKWVIDAYEQIQIDEKDWLWLVAGFEGTAAASTRAHDSGALNIQDRFSRWMPKDEDGHGTFTLQDPALGREDEAPISEVEYAAFRRTYLVGTASEEVGRPRVFAIDPQGRVVLYPLPDKGYTLRGQYRMAPQTLDGDDDIPEMPAEFHDAIKWRALVYMGIYDENGTQTPAWQSAHNRIFSRLRTHQLPQISLGGPLA